MNLIKSIVNILLFAFIAGSCIKPFEPKLISSDQSKYVISGMLTNLEGYQSVKISTTSLITEPSEIPVSLCNVTIIDDESNAFQMYEANAGEYLTWMNQIDLVVGRAYKLDVETPNGEHIMSNFEVMQPGGQLDSVYYELEDITVNTEDFKGIVHGIRVFLNAHGTLKDSRFYKWDFTETWEYHVEQPIIWWYDGIIHHEVPADSSRMICWRTVNVRDIYLQTTENLSVNACQKKRLFFINNKTQKLKHLYSLFVTQFSLSANAYTYYEQLNTNASQSGGLYVGQPIYAIGNLINQTNPEVEVLGFFGAASISQKRIFVRNVENLGFEDPPCGVFGLRKGIREISPLDYPAYLTGNEISIGSGHLDEYCVDCLRQGGTTIKPAFWPPNL